MSTHNMFAKFAVAVTVVTAALAIGAQSTGKAGARSAASATAGADAAAPATIVKIFQDSGQFKILYELLTTAKLIDRLNGAGPFTVFAPTDGAFGSLPPETLANLKKDPAALADILNYHVVAGNKSAAAVASAFELVTVQGPIIMISVWPVKDGRVMLNSVATITSADIKASNGVIHAIDTVLMPPGRRGASSGARP
ncbi:MAG: fasciclin domain-containing protein [Planctomycetaceae bacterium]|nr:fasciclin domain-containing protein [Planctomycetaceae bacterium]